MNWICSGQSIITDPVVAARVTVWGEVYLGWVVALRDVFLRGVTSCSARHYHRAGSQTALIVCVRAAADIMTPLHRKSQMIKYSSRAN